MAIANAHHGKLLLTADLLRHDRQSGLLADGRAEIPGTELTLRFPPIEDLVGALDHIASREIAA